MTKFINKRKSKFEFVSLAYTTVTGKSLANHENGIKNGLSKRVIRSEKHTTITFSSLWNNHKSSLDEQDLVFVLINFN